MKTGSSPKSPFDKVVAFQHSMDWKGSLQEAPKIVAKSYLDAVISQRSAIAKSLVEVAMEHGFAPAEGERISAEVLGKFILKYARLSKQKNSLPKEFWQNASDAYVEDFDHSTQKAIFALGMYIAIFVEEQYGEEFKLDIHRLAKKDMNFQVPSIRYSEFIIVDPILATYLVLSKAHDDNSAPDFSKLFPPSSSTSRPA